MSLLTKEQLREIISQNEIGTVGDIKETVKMMFQDIIQEMLEAEMDITLGHDRYEREGNKSNYRNGHNKKAVKSEYGEIDLKIPRDRNAEFEPQIVKKHQRDISGIADQVIALYARGMSTRDISEQLNDLYGVKVSSEMVSKITDRIIPEVRDWQNRPLDSLYTFVFMDAIVYKIRTDGQVVNRAAYVIIGVDVEGQKDVLGIWLGVNETSKFWLNVLTQLKNRGVKDVLMFSVDGLSGFKEAIETAFPKAIIQRCIVHQLRNSFKYVSYKHYKEFAKDLKTIYKAATEEQALLNLDMVEDKWGKRYPSAIKSWRDNWDVLSPFFQYAQEIRTIMYTTNIIEALNRQYRKVTKAKSVFPTDTSLEKMLYLATKQITKKWTQRYRNWDIIINQLSVLYPDRLTPFLYRVG